MDFVEIKLKSDVYETLEVGSVYPREHDNFTLVNNCVNYIARDRMGEPEVQLQWFPLYKSVEEVPDQIPIMPYKQPSRGYGDSRVVLETIDKRLFDLNKIEISELKLGLKFFN